MSLPRDELRFKVLELAVKGTSDLNEQIQRAERFFEFVMKPDDVGDANSFKRPHSKSQSGNSTILE